ncbi:MAG: FAD-dependent oxidoreductase [Lachnospiraceae bacterium]|nr:FAD-dependent oxidoreductase [Lachnospiraceae bacterium]
MSAPAFPHLFEPIRIGNTVFRNRIFSSPTSIHELTEKDYPTEALNAYFERKAMGGAASVAVGDATVDCVHGKAGLKHIPLDDPFAAGPLYGLSNAISRHGAVAAIQLQHAGMFSSGSTMDGNDAWGPVAKELKRIGPVLEGSAAKVVGMSEEQIEYTIQKFADAAAFAKNCGFGMVVVHGGHGWLISQFLSPVQNTRTDRWGGSPENRVRFLVEVLDRVRKAVGPGFPIEVRISATEGVPGGYELDGAVYIAEAIDGHCDLIHVSNGDHEDPIGFVASEPSMFMQQGVNVGYAAEIKKHVKQSKVAVVGYLNDPEFLEEVIASGKADVVELARALIADPDLPVKARNGRQDDIRTCLRCLHCFSHLVVAGRICCAINPEIGHELESKLTPAPAVKKKVLIAGGGIGGMEAAIEAAKFGHQVILCEKKAELGGALRCERAVPFKRHLDRYLNQQARYCMEDPAIDVRLNTELTPELANEIGADVIIAATGARPVVPTFLPGHDLPNVKGAEEIYYDPSLAGDKVVILGGGLVGVELGLHLSEMGRRVSVVEMMPMVGVGGNVLHGAALNVEMQAKRIDLRLSTKAVEITAEGVLVEDMNTGEQCMIDADTVIYAVGQRPEAESAQALAGCAPDFYMLGDCTTPKNIFQATNSAYNIVRDIGRIV